MSAGQYDYSYTLDHVLSLRMHLYVDTQVEQKVANLMTMKTIWVHVNIKWLHNQKFKKVNVYSSCECQGMQNSVITRCTHTPYWMGSVLLILFD